MTITMKILLASIAFDAFAKIGFLAEQRDLTRSPKAVALAAGWELILVGFILAGY